MAAWRRALMGDDREFSGRRAVSWSVASLAHITEAREWNSESGNGERGPRMLGGLTSMSAQISGANAATGSTANSKKIPANERQSFQVSIDPKVGTPRRDAPNFRRGRAVMEKHILSRRRGDHGETCRRLCGHGCIRCANGAEPKQKLRKRACQIFAFFLPIPACWYHPRPSEPSVVSSFPTAPRPRVAENFFIRVDSRACVFYGRDGRAPLFFSAPQRLCGIIWGRFGDDLGGADGDVGAPGGGFYSRGFAWICGCLCL